jgi:hypothetical protein
MRIFYIFAFSLFSLTMSAQNQARIAAVVEPEVKVLFFPNPAITQITFNFEKGYEKNQSIQIFNFIGKKVYESNSVLPKTTVDLADFYRGVYIFQIRNQAGKILQSGKFQVNK